MATQGHIPLQDYGQVEPESVSSSTPFLARLPGRPGFVAVNEDSPSSPQTSPYMDGVAATPIRRTSLPKGPGFILSRRSLRPFLLLAIPACLIIFYSALHSQIPALPGLTNFSLTSLQGQKNWVEHCVCGFSDQGKRVCDVYGEEGLSRSKLFTGSGARLKRMLMKARMGVPLKIGVLGGSVSACHGVNPTPDFPQGDPAGPACYTSHLRQYLKEAFPLRKGQQHEVINGAIGGMDSSYYAFCGTQHIAANVDLIILEFDVNDQPSHHYQIFFDQLLRVLLELPSTPAVLILGTWSPNVAGGQGYGDPQITHLPIAMYYDIPYVSWKRLVWNTYLRWPKQTKETFWLGDGTHPNARGHRILADLVIGMIESQTCQLIAAGGIPVPPMHDTIKTSHPFSTLVNVSFPFDTPKLIDPLQPPDGWESVQDVDSVALLADEQKRFLSPESPYSVPLTSIFQPLEEVLDYTKEDPETAQSILSLRQPKPFCADANDKENPMKPSLSEGWREYNWLKEKHYWVSETIGSRIRVDIKVNQGRIAVYYFRSQQYDLGDAKCWVDDNEKGAVRLPGWWDRKYNVASVAYIDEKVTPGDHYVTCEIIQETSHPDNPDAHHFRLTAVMAT